MSGNIMPLSEKSIQAAIQNYYSYSLFLDDIYAPIIILDGIVNDQIPNANDEKKSYEILLNEIFNKDNVLEVANTYKENNEKTLEELPYLKSIIGHLAEDIKTKINEGATSEAAAIGQVKKDYIDRQSKAKQNTKPLFDNEDLYKNALNKLESKDLYGIAVTDDNDLPSWPDINKTAIDIYFHEKLLSSILDVKAEITTNNELKDFLLYPIISDIYRKFKDTLYGKDLLPKDLEEEKLLVIKQDLIDKLATKINPWTKISLKDLFQAKAYSDMKTEKVPNEEVKSEFKQSYELVKQRFISKHGDKQTEINLELYIDGRIEKQREAVINSFSEALDQNILDMKGVQLASKQAEDKPKIFSEKNISSALAITLSAALIGISVANFIPAAVALSLVIVGAVTIGITASISAYNKYKANDQYKPTDLGETTPNPLYEGKQDEVKATSSTTLRHDEMLEYKAVKIEGDNQGDNTKSPQPGE
jgi:hypothetical protein